MAKHHKNTVCLFVQNGAKQKCHAFENLLVNQIFFKKEMYIMTMYLYEYIIKACK